MSYASRLERLEARTGRPGRADGPYVNKPRPSAAWWSEFERLWLEMWEADSYLPWVVPDGRPVLVDADESEEPTK